MGGDFSRIPFITRCVVSRGETTLDAMVCNISVVGAYLIVEPSLDRGEAVRLRFLLPDGCACAVESEAEVTWVNLEWPKSVDSLPPGCGLRFESMKPTDRERVAALVEDYRIAARPMIARPLPQSSFTRVPYVQPCTIDGAFRGVICNISVVGLYVAVDPIPPYKQRVTVAMRLPRTDRDIEVPAEVAWINPDEPVEVGALPPGCGLRFTHLDAGVAQAISALVDDFLSIPRELPPWLAAPNEAASES